MQRLTTRLILLCTLLCAALLLAGWAAAENKPAEFVKDISCAGSWPNSFWDIGTAACWECPKSAPKRTILPVTGGWACERPAHEVFKRAIGPEKPTGLIGTDCRKGWFLDIGLGKCYSCQGYNRTLYPVTHARACSRLEPLVKAQAARRGSPGGCPDGSFQHLLSSKCYRCPAGSYRNANTGADPTTFNACTVCGGLGGRPCPVTTLRRSCDENLAEDFSRGICIAVACGKENGKPCTIAERIPSCDTGLVEDFLKNRCVKSETRKRQEIAAKKLAEIASFVADKVGYATGVAQNPNVVQALNSDKPEAAAQSVSTAAVGGTTLPDGAPIRTMTVGATVGAKAIVGGSAGAGAAIDFTGRLPVYAYATADYDISLGFGVAGGVDVGFWVCQANKIGGDSWGAEFGPKDIVDFAKVLKGVEGASLANMVKPGLDVGVTLWFGYDNVFQGFVLTPSVGAGIDFGGVVWATTAVQDDPTVGCDGAPIHAGTQPAPPTGGIKPIFGSGEQFIQDIAYTNGAIHGSIRQSQTRDAVADKALTRVCVVNSTATPKRITHSASGVNHLVADSEGSESCANFPARTRLNFSFVDDGKVVRSDAMNLDAYAGSLVRFEWLSTVGTDQTFVQDIHYQAPVVLGGGTGRLIRHFRVDGGSGNPAITRVCMLNKTLHAKTLEHQVSGVGKLIAAGKDAESCANFAAATRLELRFRDRGSTVRSDAMNLSAYAGDIVRFTWLLD